MRKVMLQLDRIYFQPLFHKKCQFLLKSRRPPPPPPLLRMRKGRLNKRLEKPLKVKVNSKANTSQIKFSREEIAIRNPVKRNLSNQGMEGSKISLQNVKDMPLSRVASSSSLKTLREGIPQNEFCKRRSKVGSDIVPLKPRLKVSRKLRLWLEKRKIIIFRRKMVNTRLKCHRHKANTRTQLLKW